LDLKPDLVVADRFRLVRPLGQGGMGAVWVAQHTALDTPCAVKFIHEEAARSPDLRVRFEREAKAAAQLRSPHVVQILDHGVWQGCPYIAMELLEGEDLSQRLRRRRPLPAREVVAIAAQVGRALTRAHAAGLVHRDLKPANIFLVKDDDREIAKVLDFGVAKSTSVTAAATADGSGDGDTKTGVILGTPFYMSPEQARGNRDIDHRADLWALTVVVYQCLTGKLPFRSEALGDLLVKIIVEPLPIPSAIAALPPSFDAWWKRAADRDITARFQTAKELTDALGLAFDVTLSGASEVGSSVSLAVPRELRSSLADGPVPLHDSASGASAAPVTDAGVTDAVPPQAPVARRTPLLVAVTAGVLLLGGIGVVVALRGSSTSQAGLAPPVSVATGEPPAPLPPAAMATASVSSAAAIPAPSAPSATAATTASPATKPRPYAAPHAGTAPANGPKPRTDFGI
jgi:serine/threonine protein kinase